MRKGKIQSRDRREAALAKVIRQQLEEVQRASFPGDPDAVDLLMEAVFAPSLGQRLAACSQWADKARKLKYDEEEAARTEVDGQS